MSSRPRRSAAQRATVAITDMADRDNDRIMSSRARRSGGATSLSRGGPSPSSPTSSAAESATGNSGHLTVKVPSNKLRQATGGNKRVASAAATSASPSTRGPYGRSSTSSAAAAGKRTRGTKKSYVVVSES